MDRQHSPPAERRGRQEAGQRRRADPRPASPDDQAVGLGDQGVGDDRAGGRDAQGDWSGDLEKSQPDGDGDADHAEADDDTLGPVQPAPSIAFTAAITIVGKHAGAVGLPGDDHRIGRSAQPVGEHRILPQASAEGEALAAAGLGGDAEIGSGPRGVGLADAGDVAAIEHGRAEQTRPDQPVGKELHLRVLEPKEPERAQDAERDQAQVWKKAVDRGRRHIAIGRRDEEGRGRQAQDVDGDQAGEVQPFGPDGIGQARRVRRHRWKCHQLPL